LNNALPSLLQGYRLLEKTRLMGVALPLDKVHDAGTAIDSFYQGRL